MDSSLPSSAPPSSIPWLGNLRLLAVAATAMAVACANGHAQTTVLTVPNNPGDDTAAIRSIFAQAQSLGGNVQIKFQAGQYDIDLPAENPLALAQSFTLQGLHDVTIKGPNLLNANGE